MSTHGIVVERGDCKGTDLCFFASYDTGLEAQIDHSKDFMNNQRYRYYLLKDIEDSGGIIFGNYFLISEDVSLVERMLSDHLTGVKSVPLLTGSDMRAKDTANLIMSVSFVAIIMLFVAMVFARTNDSRKIAIAKLNGLSSKDIHKMVNPPIKYIVYGISIILYLVLLYFTRHLKLRFTMMYVSFILVLTFILEIISMLATFLIVSKINASTAMKNEPYTGLLYSVNTVVKIGVLASLLVVFTSLSYETIEYIKTKKSINAYSDMFDLAMFETPYSEKEDEDIFFDNLLSFYKEASLHFVTVTSQFSVLMYKYNLDVYYKPFSIEQRKFDEELQKSLNYFGLARVDKNFLQREKIELFDPQGNPVDLSIDYDENIILLPKSDVHLWNDIKTSIIENNSFSHVYLNYFNRDIFEDTYQYFYYENRSIQSNLPEISENGEIESPWMYLESPSNLFTFQYPGGLGVAGMGMYTHVKFVVPKELTRVELYQRLRLIS